MTKKVDKSMFWNEQDNEHLKILNGLILAIKDAKTDEERKKANKTLRDFISNKDNS